MSPRRALGGREHDPRLADLEYLRKGPGLTPARLATRTVLLPLLDTTDPVEGAKRLDELVASLSNDRRCAALHAAFGYGRGDTRLAQRRQATAVRYGKSPDTIRDWEDQAIGEVLLVLLAENPEPPLPTPPFLMENMRVDYLMVDRDFVRCRHHRDVVALRNDIPHFRYGISEQVPLEKVWGADAILDEQTPTGPIYRMRFPKLLQRGDRHSFGWDEVADPDAPESPPITQDQASQIFHMPASSYQLSVTFRGEIPRVIWRFEQLAQAERPGQPTRSNLLTADQTGKVSASFDNLYGGFCSGIGWRWPSH